MQPMPNIRGVAPNAMANTMANNMPNAINAMNANNMNMNMGMCNRSIYADFLVLLTLYFYSAYI